MFRRILLPLDGSVAAEVVLDIAGSLVRGTGAAVDLLHVIPDRKSLARMGPEDPLDWRMSCRRASEYLAGVQGRLAQKEISASTRVEEGGPAAVIVALLREAQHDLVVFTPHGMGGRGELAIGATAGAVILHAPTSLLLVPAGYRARPLSRILVPVDGSPRAEWSVSVAFHLAESLGADLHLVHALAPTSRFGSLPQGPAVAHAAGQVLEANRTSALRYMASVQTRNAPGKPGVASKVLESEGDTPATILNEVRAVDADMVVLSAHGREGSAGPHLGAVPLRLLLASPVPVLVMQDHLNPSNPKGTVRQDASDSHP